MIIPARHARIAATGRYIPERCVTNEELDMMLGENVGDWLVEKVGIRERHIMNPLQTTSDMIVAAAHEALQRAELLPEEVDLIIVATDTPDYISPATASAVQAKLSAKNAGTFDINCACAGWVTGLDMAGRYIATDPDIRHILVAGGYGMSKFVDWTDKYTCTLFADGAACAIVSAGDVPGFIGGKLTADGSYHDAMGIYTGGTFRPATPDVITELGKPCVEFVKKFPSTFNSDNWPPLVRSVVEKTGLRLDDIGKFYFTQLNRRTIEYVIENLGQAMTKTHCIMDKWGYIGSACIPAALDDAIEKGNGPAVGENVIFCATGGGMAMACSLWKW